MTEDHRMTDSHLAWLEVKLTLNRLESMLLEIQSAVNPQGLTEFSGVYQKILLKNYPFLSWRKLKSIRTTCHVGRKIGRDIVYTKEEVAQILQHMQFPTNRCLSSNNQATSM